ncbi:hypothetical protein I118_1117 [Bifidobacterium longum D2957]|nr:hypothetical protein I118_1117 [Bifidobacterium longum D2957]
MRGTRQTRTGDTRPHIERHQQFITHTRAYASPEKNRPGPAGPLPEKERDDGSRPMSPPVQAASLHAWSRHSHKGQYRRDAHSNPLNGGTVSRGSIRASSLSHNGTPRRRSHGRRAIAALTMRASYEPSADGRGSA